MNDSNGSIEIDDHAVVIAARLEPVVDGVNVEMQFFYDEDLAPETVMRILADLMTRFGRENGMDVICGDSESFARSLNARMAPPNPFGTPVDPRASGA